MTTYIGCRPRPSKCPYLTSREDYHKTTIFPACTCGRSYCNSYHGYCPVRDDRD